MRQIKFRGLDYMFSREISGDLLQEGKLQMIVHDGFRATVKPGSVRQLVGHDADGREVYEGDLLIDEAGIEYRACLHPTGTAQLTLKETDYDGRKHQRAATS